jgi:hypothetical protein
VNSCDACGEDFGSVAAFDKHRVGSHAYCHDETRTDGRRCLSVSEIEAIGLVRNSRGRWSLPSSLAFAQAQRQGRA